MELPAPDKCIYIDVETNNILLEDVTKFHCVVITYPWGISERFTESLKVSDNTYKPYSLFKEYLKHWIAAGYTPVLHHGAGYDIAVIHKFFPELIDIMTVDGSVDTLLLSCMLFPERKQGHSLDVYGEELGIAKVQNDDWETCTHHMINRCVVDTEITKKLYAHLYTAVANMPVGTREAFKEALTLESRVSHIHQKQMNHGVAYDMPKALEHYNWLELECKRLEEKILRGAPWSCIVHGVPLKDQDLVKNSDAWTMYQLGFKVVEPFKKDGSVKKTVKDYFGPTLSDTVEGPYSRIECKPMNLSSSDEVKSYLLSLGWRPTEWNYSFKDGRKVRNSPKLTEDSFSSIPPGLGQDIANYRTYTHRKNSILNIDEAKGTTKGAVSTIRKDGRISAEAITCGTPTARYRHMKTVCNIPRPSSVFGHEIRSTFTVEDGHLMIGADLSGIESRMLAHYLRPYVGSEEIIKVILSEDKSEDFHTRNARIWSVDRNTAKSGLYALMYGCYPKKLATTLGYDESRGQQLHDDFWAANGPIKDLIVDLEKSYDANGGYILGLDGRRIYVREKRKLLNTLLQNAATIVFKRWMVLVDDYVSKRDAAEPQVHQVIAYHDELQFEYYSDDLYFATKFAEVVCDLALKAGEHYGVTVPTPADYKIGKNWADTH